jgi:hypothetical protein
MEQATGERPSQLKGDQVAVQERNLLSALEAARQELGRWPGGREWERASAAHAARRTYVRRFGTWENACQAAARPQERVLS